MRILIDTNVLIDYLSEREPFSESARQIIIFCKNREADGCIAAHSVTNIFYILRHEIPEAERREILKALCELLTVIGIDKQKLADALDNSDFKDMEDCLQAECAESFHADYIITRNIKDFKTSSVPAIFPEDFIKLMK